MKTKVIDRIFISSKAKQHAVLEKARINPETVIITWFEESYHEVKNLLQPDNLKAEIFLSREISSHNISGKKSFVH